MLFFFSSRRRHTRSTRDWSSDVCSSDLFLVGDDYAHGADHAAGAVVQLQLALEAIAPGVDLEVRLAREHAAHVVVVGLLAEAPDVRAGDDVVIAVGRCGVYGENLHPVVALDELLHELLRVSVARRVGLVGVGLEEMRIVRDSTVEPVANALRAVLERAAVEAGVMEVSQAQRSNAIVRYVAE